MNPMLQSAVKATSGGISDVQLETLANQIKAIKNPQALISQYPQLANIINFAHGDLRGAVNLLCQQKGINPQDFLNKISHIFSK